MKNNDEIDISFYKLFYDVCKYGSFSKTAEMLGVTQPSISYNIKKLEDYLGIKLFERGNTMLLTPEAESLLPYVEEAISSLNNGVRKINDLINLKNGQITIGVPSHIGVFLLTNIIEDFNKKYPEIKFKVISKTTKELFRLLRLKELDIVIDCSPLNESVDNLTIVKITKERCSFVCNNKNKELTDKKIKIKDLVKYPLIVPLRTSSNTKLLKTIFDKSNILFEPKYEISTSDMILEMVEKNLGIGFLFEKTICGYNNLKIINLEEELPFFDIFMIYQEHLLSSSTIAFINFLNYKFR